MYISSIRSMWREKSAHRRSRIRKNFSPPYDSPWNATSKVLAAQPLCPPQGVFITASSSVVHNT